MTFLHSEGFCLKSRHTILHLFPWFEMELQNRGEKLGLQQTPVSFNFECPCKMVLFGYIMMTLPF